MHGSRVQKCTESWFMCMAEPRLNEGVQYAMRSGFSHAEVQSCPPFGSEDGRSFVNEA